MCTPRDFSLPFAPGSRRTCCCERSTAMTALAPSTLQCMPPCSARSPGPPAPGHRSRSRPSNRRPAGRCRPRPPSWPPSRRPTPRPGTAATRPEGTGLLDLAPAQPQPGLPRRARSSGRDPGRMSPIAWNPGPVAGLDELFEACHATCPARRPWDRDRAPSSGSKPSCKTGVQDTVPS